MEPNNADGIVLQVELRRKRKEQQEKDKLINKKIIEHDFDGQHKPFQNEISERIPRKPLVKEKIFNFKALIVDLLRSKILKSANEEFLGRVEEIEKEEEKEKEPTSQTIPNMMKFLFLLPLNLLSEICCRRRLPSQFFKADLLEKNKIN